MEIDVARMDLPAQTRELKNWVGSAHPSSVFRIGHLPLEVISYIFELYVLDDEQRLNYPATTPPPFEKPSPLVLISVCRYWRTVTEATPQLWTKISHCLQEAGAEFQTNHLNVWLRRSGQLPLTIKLWAQVVNWGDRTLSVPPFMSFIEAVNSCSHRWKDFRLIDLPHHFYPLFIGGVQGTPMLEFLSIQPAEDYEEGGNFELVASKPAPRIFEISHTYLRRLQINFCVVTEIIAWRVTAEDIVEMIRLSPMLEKLEWEDGDLPDWEESDNAVAPAPAINHSLKRFSLKCATGEDEDCLRVFRFLTLPALQHLDCQFEDYDKDEGGEILASFFERSCCPLVEIALRGAPMLDSDLLETFRHLPTVQNANILVRDEFVGKGTNSFCYSLLYKTDPVLLPSLNPWSSVLTQNSNGFNCHISSFTT